MFESNTMSRRERFNWLVNNPQSISGAVTYFESVSNLLYDFSYRERCGLAFYRLFMWRYFLLTHQKYIPPYFRSYIGEKQLVSQMVKDGTRNNEELENILNTLKIKCYEF
jgi:hypothetical protein